MARYTSSDARYAIDRADTITFQYPNGVQTQVVDRSIWVRLIIGPGTTTAPVNITLDSIRVANVPRDSLISADGLRWTGTLEDGVRLGTLTPSAHHALAEQLVGEFLPRPRRDTAAGWCQVGDHVDRHHRHDGAGGRQ